MTEAAPREVRPHPASREVTTPAELAEVLADGGSLRGVRLRDLDLAAHEAELLTRTDPADLAGLVVLGGGVSDRLAAHLRRHGALLFPGDAGAPISPYRATLYRPEELYEGLDGGGYESTADARTYAWSRDARLARDDYVTLLRAIHDESMTDALTEMLEGHRVVGVMGGHAMRRDSEAYAGAARLGYALARAGRVVLTGGGPGAMEAAGLGALAAGGDEGGDEAALTRALEELAAVPSFRPSVGDWARLALRVRAALPAGTGTTRSVGVPTWFYGHEPPGVFCDGIAKYFSNALREDTLLARCDAGLVVLPGAAGTVQEIFQATTPLHYAAAEARVPPLVLVDERHWREVVPVWPALQALTADRPHATAVHLVDDVDDAAELIAATDRTR